MEIQNVLLVDDDKNIRFLAQMCLQDLAGWKVNLASSGQEALDILSQGKPDLVLLDVMMPGMDGKTTFTKIKEFPELCDIPIIFMTASVQTHEMQAYLDLGAVGVLVKPFDPMTLADQIKKLMAN
jgi:CheY-like chemotaxis protein